jgi:chorismate dehydratase
MAAASDRPLRLGRVGFINTFPVEWALERFLAADEAEEVVGVPTALNAMLRAGEVDVANVSSIEYARGAGGYVLLPSLCVGSDGAVGSVEIVSPRPLEDVRSIAATSQSATSVALTRILFPRAEIRSQDAEADARLLIGDAALRSSFDDPTPHHDLGELWRERTGLPMVFAVWAARADVDPERLTRIDQALTLAVDEARTHAIDVARAAAARHGFPAGYLARYFEHLRYRFGARQREGLERFYALAAEAGAIPSVPDLRFARAGALR